MLGIFDPTLFDPAVFDKVEAEVIFDERIFDPYIFDSYGIPPPTKREEIIRFLPVQRVVFRQKLRVSGSKVFFVEDSQRIHGCPSKRQKTSIDVRAGVLRRVKKEVAVEGAKKEEQKYTLRTSGSKLQIVEITKPVTGEPKENVLVSMSIKGRKDLKKLILELLEDEE